jgi:hypothetical protein
MTLSGRDFRVAVAASALAALPGCKQILGLHDRAEAQTDGGAQVIKPVTGACGTLRHPSASCAACMDTNCCDQASACHDDPACDPAWDCNMTCGDDGACRARCTTFFTRAESLVELSACRETNCRAECALSCGGFAYQAPSCGACVKQSCCSAAADCAKNPECMKLDLCRNNCIAGSSTCPPECERSYPGGVSDLASWIDCLQNTCSEACTVGRNWACLDTKTPWLKPKSAGDITFAISIVEIVGEKPFANHTLKACSKLDRDCTAPLATAVSDKDGFAALTVPAGSVGFDGYVDIQGPDGAGDAIFPAIWYPSPNIVSSGWRGRIQFPSRASLQTLAALTGATIDATRGHFAAAAQDCNFAAAPGVSFDVDTKDNGTTVFYFVQGIPKTGSTTQTDAQSGIGGYINLPTDRVSLISARVQIGDAVRSLGMGSTYIIRPGTFTTTSMPPMP